MKKNLYYAHVFQRKNALKELIYSIAISLCSWPRILIEVFLRKNFGERYFSFYVATIILIALFSCPFLFAGMARSYGVSYSVGQDYDSGFWHIIGKNILWYLYLAGFYYMCIQRRKEVKRLPSVFDFARFSLSTGVINPKFYEIKIGGIKPTSRIISTIFEPAVFFIPGVVLMFFGQPLGDLLVSSSIAYSISYFAAYHIGDNYIMDKIDEMICNEDLVDAFMGGEDTKETRGFSPYGQMPSDPDLRRKVAESFIVDEVVDAF